MTIRKSDIWKYKNRFFVLDMLNENIAPSLFDGILIYKAWKTRTYNYILIDRITLIEEFEKDMFYYLPKEIRYKITKFKASIEAEYELANDDKTNM